MIGSSPTVLETMRGVIHSVGEDTPIITCNSGIKLWEVPHFYAAVDTVSTHTFHDEAILAQQAGTQLITLLRGEKAQRDRKIEHFDIHLELGNGDPSRSEYGAFRYTGPLCVEFACHHGAKRIHLVGFDGYRHETDYFDGSATHRKTGRAMSVADSTQEVLRPRMQQLAEVWHDVEFIQYGEPCFTIDCPNWAVVHTGAKV